MENVCYKTKYVSFNKHTFCIPLNFIVNWTASSQRRHSKAYAGAPKFAFTLDIKISWTYCLFLIKQRKKNPFS